MRPLRLLFIAAAWCTLAAACQLSTSGLVGGGSDDDGAASPTPPEAGPPILDPTCGADTRSDPYHCGACGNACPFGPQSIPTCALGSCGTTCNTGYENCDGELGNGCEAALARDPGNCGRCGRVCAGGTCVNGACPPAVVTASRGNIYALTIDETKTHLYWLERYGATGALYECTLPACPTPRELASNVRNATALAVRGAIVYWLAAPDTTQTGAVYSCTLPACNPVSALVTFPGFARGLAVDGTSIFFGSQVTNAHVLRRCPTTSCSSGTTVAMPLPFEPLSLGLDADAVYVLSRFPYKVARAEFSPGATVTSLSAQGVFGWSQLTPVLTTDALALYWASGQAVRRVPKEGVPDAGAPPALFESPPAYPSAVAVATANVYVSTSTGILTVPKNGAAPTTLADIPYSQWMTVGTKLYVVRDDTILAVDLE